jgi:arsenate reductase-like glutaredoxin family protein
LRDAGIEVDEIDYAKNGLTEDQVTALITKVGGVAPLLNTRNAVVKEKGWVVKPPTPKAFAKAVSEDVNLLKRPILIDGDTIIIGFDRPAYAKLKPAKAKSSK